MPKFTMKHEIECDAAAFWKLFFDKEFNVALFKALDFPKYELVDQTETDREIRRKVIATPKMDVPGPVAKLMGSGFSYTEDGTFDKASRVLRWKATPSSMSEKVRNEGTVRVEDAGPGKCRRVAEFDYEAKVFGIGGMIESSLEKGLRSGWDKSAAFINEWVRTHKS